MYMKDPEYCGFPEKQPVHVRSHGKITKSCKKKYVFCFHIFFLMTYLLCIPDDLEQKS